MYRDGLFCATLMIPRWISLANQPREAEGRLLDKRLVSIVVFEEQLCGVCDLPEDFSCNFPLEIVGVGQDVAVLLEGGNNVAEFYGERACRGEQVAEDGVLVIDDFCHFVDGTWHDRGAQFCFFDIGCAGCRGLGEECSLVLDGL